MKRTKTKLWIQKVNLKKGGLSRQLNIPQKENIPITLLEKISKVKIGETVTNPTKKGKKRIKVTRLLKKRSVFARNVKRFKK